MENMYFLQLLTNMSFFKNCLPSFIGLQKIAAFYKNENNMKSLFDYGFIPTGIIKIHQARKISDNWICAKDVS